MKTSTLLTVLFIGLLSGLGGMAAGSSIFAGAQNGANPAGAQNTRPADPTDPQTKNYLSILQEYTNPAQFLKLNLSALTKIQDQQTALEAYWESNHTFSSQDDLMAAKAILANQAAQIQKLINFANNSSDASNKTLDQLASPDALETIRKQIVANTTALRLLLNKTLGRPTGPAGSAIDLANQIIARNTTDSKEGTGPIKYAPGLKPEITEDDIKNNTYNGKSLVDAIQSADCSGFISYLLMSVGVIDKRKTTDTLASDTADFTTLNIDENGNGIVDGTEVEDAIALGLKTPTVKDKNGNDIPNPNALLPGDIIISGLVNGHESYGKSHVVMIAKSDYKASDGVVESSDSGGKSGPYHQSLENRTNYALQNRQIGQQVLFKRPNYH